MESNIRKFNDSSADCYNILFLGPKASGKTTTLNLINALFETGIFVPSANFDNHGT
jgi:ABC-type proline/glycine betaine transport system ATPase subunit